MSAEIIELRTRLRQQAERQAAVSPPHSRRAVPERGMRGQWKGDHAGLPLSLLCTLQKLREDGRWAAILAIEEIAEGLLERGPTRHD